ncbi:tyrosine-type recombinase/integrase [Ewingella americana]|uniref:Site-specific integrase n=1 Tax=Ewingella americana TaxID=41202 RepID=A0A502GM48_9GAMM|nr:site-specific integrase [Ewingella americana]TPG62592.1 site-specific integrase [Ewingella americana]
MLTDTKLRKSLGKRRDKVEVISDAQGLNVRLSVSGGITFFYRYRWEDKPVQLSIGDYPSITLSQARERRQQFRAWLTEGYDPRRQVKLEKQQKTEALTVEEAFTYWETYYCKPEGIVKIKVNRQNFDNHVKPVLGNMIVNQTTKLHWLSLFDQMGRRVVTGNVLGLMQRAFRFCSNRDVIDFNPIESLKRSDVGLTAAMKDRKLSDDEIRVLWNALDGMPPSQQLVIRFLLLTGCRSTEIRTAKWEWFDYKEKTWTVPASEYKTGRTVRRALPDSVIFLLEEHQKWSMTNHVLTPPHFKNREDKPPSQPRVAAYSAQVISKTGMKNWSLHDLRRTVATRLSELGAPPHVIEKLLGHQMGGVMARYNLHDYLADQHQWLTVWLEHLEKVVGRPLTPR